MYARVSPGEPDIEVWEQANAGAKKLAIVLKITGTCCKCRRKAVEASGPNLRSCVDVQDTHRKWGCHVSGH
jgi:hypothetical protein